MLNNFFSPKLQSQHERINYIGNIYELKDSCRYVGIRVCSELKFDAKFNPMMNAKMSTATRSTYLLRRLIPLKARIMLFK